MSKLIKRIALSVVTMAWAIWYLVDTASRAPKAVLLIRPVVYIMGVLFLINLVRDIRKWRLETKGDNEGFEYASSREIKIALISVAAVAVYVLSINFLGFIISTVIFLAGAFIALKAKTIPAICMATVMTGLLYVVFKILLKMPLPRGFLGF